MIDFYKNIFIMSIMSLEYFYNVDVLEILNIVLVIKQNQQSQCSKKFMLGFNIYSTK